MATVDQISRNQLRVSAYDKVSSWLLSLLLITGITVGGLLFIYFTRQLIVKEVAIPVTPVSAGGGGTGGTPESAGAGSDLAPPGAEDAPELLEPQLRDTLSAVASVVATNSALLADESIEASREPGPGKGQGDSRRPGFGGGSGGGSGGGIGSGFGKGRGGPGEPQREIRFEPADLAEYARWLDHFKIELGVLGKDNKVHYAYNLSRPTPDVRTGDPVDEQRLYMNSAYGEFAPLDRQLVEKAGIADKGPIVLQFYPAETQAILYSLEQKHAGDRKPEAIRRTVFRVTTVGQGFEFSVEEQFYR
jgi:hypothetical protein